MPHIVLQKVTRCGDLIFRDFYQEAIETLEFAKKQKIFCGYLKYIHTVKKDIMN